MDMTLIRTLAKEYEDGRRDAESVMAKACLEAYDQGFEDGVHETEQTHFNAQILLHCTAGNA
jgi:hypothetical protein